MMETGNSDKSQHIISGNDKRNIELLEEIGQGKNGIVWKSRYQSSRIGDPIYLAVKQLLSSTPLSWKKLSQEAKAMTVLAKLRNPQPNIIRLYDFFEYPPQDPASKVYLVMEFYSGYSLAQLELTRDEILDCFYQMAEALEYVHAHGILHKDIKPDNIILTRNDANVPIFKLADFGQAFVPEDEGGDALNLHGSIKYVAPELLLGEKEIGPSADLYSLAAVIYELITEKTYLPFTGNRQTDAELILKRQEPVTLAHTVLPPISNPLRHKVSYILQKALNVKPQDRYQNATELLKDLKEVIIGKSPKVVEQTSQQPSNQVTVSGNVFQFISGDVVGAVSNKQEQHRPFMSPPLPPQGIFGREESMSKIFELLQLEDDKASNISPITLLGMGGIGKTTLTIALSRLELIPHYFPDGVLWVELGAKPIVRSRLVEWGDKLGLDLKPYIDEESCITALRSALYDRKMLIIVDDIWQVRHGQSFNVGGPYTRTVFTTRESPIAYTLATSERTLSVNLLNPDASLALLGKLAPQAVVQANSDKAEQLCKKLEYLPLALTLAGRYLALESDLGQDRLARALDELLEQRDERLNLSDVEGRPYLPDDQPASLWDILGRSVDRLSQTDKERFAKAANFGGEPLTWDLRAAVRVWNCTSTEAEKSLRELIQRGLVAARPNNRYWMHALLADYAEVLRVKMGL